MAMNTAKSQTTFMVAYLKLRVGTS